MVWLESKILCPPIRLRAWLETKGLGEMEGKYSYFYFTHHLFIFLIFYMCSNQISKLRCRLDRWRLGYTSSNGMIKLAELWKWEWMGLDEFLFDEKKGGGMRYCGIGRRG